MLHKVFDFADTDVDDVMVPRPDVVALAVTLTPAEACARARPPVHALPGVRGRPRRHLRHPPLRRLFAAMQDGGLDRPTCAALLRPAHVVPETKRLDELLAEFRRDEHTWRRGRRVRLGGRPRHAGGPAGGDRGGDRRRVRPPDVDPADRQGPRADRGLVPDRRVQRALRHAACRRGLPQHRRVRVRRARPRRRAGRSRALRRLHFRVHSTDGPRILSVDVELSARAADDVVGEPDAERAE